MTATGRELAFWFCNFRCALGERYGYTRK
ncbi:hypothetical protein RALTA_B0261 [Cupriavidus taiwanensis LMG 19424]|uniref:Uncharacterized protein n=1 Tax=Cupriavidus taiwanensis (strain DSM 17343 / BCRC 17206 / CCUG 44338 / CIP 107171 / LMG 19424 / R1) TaxID=977880 RepID=B2AI60_CUPTR|nr:hypothetical protein RALTA_B0261 [Cupriavidus taiwanensis LMG 19424]